MEGNTARSKSWVSAWFYAGIWGVLWAIILQYTYLGRWLAVRRTWITVVIGVGGTLAAGLPAVDIGQFVRISGLFAASSIGIIIRSIYNEWKDEA